MAFLLQNYHMTEFICYDTFYLEVQSIKPLKRRHLIKLCRHCEHEKEKKNTLEMDK